MWSKQADARNKQATSFKNKMSHRKRKGDKVKNQQQQASPVVVEVKEGGGKQRKQKNKKQEQDVCDNKMVRPDLIEGLKQCKDDVTDVITSRVLDTSNFAETDVVLRKKPASDGFSEKQKANDVNNTVKRYSDSFVTDKPISHPDNAPLSRAHSGFFYPSSEGSECAKEKKTRRFSDLFRHTSVKTNCDSVKSHVNMITQFDISDNGHVITLQTPNDKQFPKPEAKNKTKDKKSSVQRTDSKKLNQVKPTKATAKTNQTPKDDNTSSSPSPNTNNSVLKRVRSKIYKHKNENCVSAIPTMPGICENRENDCKADLKRPTSHFDFRLIRQTSNLERIRPKTFTHKKTQSVDASANNNGFFFDEKPVLAKSKSSSAINLNLLRSRRNKLLDSMKSCKPVQDEFDFIAFGGIKHAGSCAQLPRKFGSQDLSNHLNNNNNNNNNNVPSVRRSSWIGAYTGETKPGNPVTRTPSDRRPDAVREESSRTQDAHVQPHDTDNDATNPESSVSLPASTGGNKRRQHSNINRSESVKEQSEKNRKHNRRNISDPLHTTSETVDLDHQGPFHPHSGSSSNSSLSSRSLESPSSNADAVSDSDLEVEADPPDWKSALTDEQLSRLHPDEKKRQDVINELFHTERSHVRNLKVLDQVFRRNIVENRALTEPELKLVFANLSEVLSIHNQFNQAMKNKRKENTVVSEIGDILLNMFDGELGNNFCTAAAKFCEKQQLALEIIKEKRKKDSKFESVLATCEKNNLCRRLPLQGFVPQEMQRLSKYPLLLERLIASEEKMERENLKNSANAETEKLTSALEKSREILNKVNEAAKLAYNKARLEDISEHLDKVLFERSEHSVANDFKNFELTNYTLIHEGIVTLRRHNKTPLSVHMLLLQEAVILLQREGERYVLKFFQAGSQPLAPIIKMSNVICRKNAADYVTLFLVSNTQNSQMYEIQCRDASERKMWFKYLTDATEPYKLKDGKGKRAERNHDPEEETVQDLPTRAETSERTETIIQDVDSTCTAIGEGSQKIDMLEEEREEKRPKQDNDGAIPAMNTAGDGVSIKLTANDWPLIQPSEVQVAFPPVHTAEPVLTPLEQIRRKDEEVKQALAAKEVLVADLLSIPREDYHLIADIASDEATKKSPCEREPSELVLASVYQVDQLLAAVNNSLNISETDPVLTTGGKHPACASNDSAIKLNNVPSVPVSRLQDIATTLNSQLTILLSVVKQREEERDKMRKEIQKMREQMHEMNNLHGPQSAFDDKSTQYDSLQSGDLESIEESPTETETT